MTELSVTPATVRLVTVPGGGGGGTAVTVTVAVPLCPSLVAVSVAVPAATPVTRPLPFTVATPGALLAQVTTRPASGVPLASFGVAVSCTVCPTCTLAVAGLTVTDTTGTGTTAVTVSVAVPAATPVTRPLPFTVATPGALLAQVTTRPASGVPLASFGVAVSCTVCPTCTLAVAGLTATEATGTFTTVIAAVPFRPSLLAVIVAVPVAPAVTSPVPLTMA